MKLQNGDVGYIESGRDTRHWSIGVPAAVASLILIAPVAVYSAFDPEGYYTLWLVSPEWVISLLFLGFIPFPGAYLCGRLAGNYLGLSKSVAIASIGIFVGFSLTNGTHSPLIITVYAFVSSLIVASFIYFIRRLRGFQPIRSADSCSSLRCVKCGYWLPGLSEHRCPECGTPFGRQDVARP